MTTPPKTIDEYLEQLQAALKDADRAMTQDALRPYVGMYQVTDARISHRSVATEISLRSDGLYAGLFRLRPIGNNVFVPVGDPYHHYTFTVRDGKAVALHVEREGRVIADARRSG